MTYARSSHLVWVEAARRLMTIDNQHEEMDASGTHVAAHRRDST